jgi:hypothetical protein
MAQSEEAFTDISALVKSAARKRMLFLPHAVTQMSRPDRMITVEEIRGAVHVVCAPRESYLAIITAYLPEKHEWDQNFKIRRQP